MHAVAPAPGPGPATATATAGALLPAGLMLGALGALTVLADPVSRYTAATAEQLLHPAGYVSTVLGGPAAPRAPAGGPR